MVVMTDPTARTLVLVRHAKAESGEEGADHERRLTSRGQAAAAQAGQWLASVVPIVDAVWCSSATRAVQTWAAIAASVDAPEPTVGRDLYLAGPTDVIERLSGQPGEPGTITVVVGHNPTVEQVLASLVGKLHRMRPGAVAVVDLEAGRLADFWEPPR